MNGDALAERLEEMRDSLATFTDGMKAAARDGALADIAALTEAATRLRAVAGELVAASGKAAAWQSRVRPDSGKWLAWNYFDGSIDHDNDPSKFPLRVGRWECEYRALYLHPATVTDEDVERACRAFYGPQRWEHMDGKDAVRSWMRAALESFANKEPTDE